MSGVRPPLIAISPWRRSLPTSAHPVNDLYTIDPEYLDGVERAGGHAALLGFARDIDDAKDRLSPFGALLLSGGDDVDPAHYGATVDGAVDMNPIGDRSDEAYLAAALELGLPVLGICRGIQIINVTLGGSLLQDIWGSSDNHPARNTGPDPVANADEMLTRRHDVRLEPGSLIAKIFDAETIETNSLHHQAIERVAEDLVVTGRAGDGIIEVVEHRSQPLLAVQWHPEQMPPGEHDAVFAWLVNAAGAR